MDCDRASLHPSHLLLHPPRPPPRRPSTRSARPLLSCLFVCPSSSSRLSLEVDRFFGLPRPLFSCFLSTLTRYLTPYSSNRLIRPSVDASSVHSFVQTKLHRRYGFLGHVFSSLLSATLFCAFFFFAVFAPSLVEGHTVVAAVSAIDARYSLLTPPKSFPSPPNSRPYTRREAFSTSLLP